MISIEILVLRGSDSQSKWYNACPIIAKIPLSHVTYSTEEHSNATHIHFTNWYCGHKSTAFSLPFCDGGWSRTRLGELATIAALNDERRRVPLAEVGESDCPYTPCVGLPGSELFDRGEREGAELSPPAFASVRRNSTHNRENDCRRRRVSSVNEVK